LDILYHSSAENNNKPTTITTQQLHSNLQRARDILQSLPELHSSTYLISTDLYALCGQFDLALESLARYNHSLQQQQQQQQHGKMKKLTKQKRIQLQFLQAKLYTLSGQFTLALSEYEDLLETMEQDVERQMKHHQRSEMERGVSVIDGAATLTGVGLTKFLLLLYQNQEEGENPETTSTINEIMEAMETSTDMLLESRQDALHSPKHADLAIDLGIAASISLTNLGVAHCLLTNNKVKSIELWKKGLDTLDTLLSDAMNTATIIPRHKFMWMESIRARLHCDIACLLLGLVDPSSSSKQLDDDTLKHASEAAKKALDIYDELINGAKILRGDNGSSNNNTQDGNDDDDDDDDDNKREWERILKEEVKKKQENDDDDDKPPEVSLSPLWIDYHRCESARAFGLVAHCYAQAGAAVTSEGLFQSALDASSSYPFGQSLRSSSSSNVVEGGKGIALSSPNLGLIARDVRLWYAMLCNNWEKRKGDADRLLADAQKIEKDMIFQGHYSSSSSQEGGKKKRVPGMISSLWLFNPIDFERK
jgi:tetratricopeptide (TPR) repeat protein